MAEEAIDHDIELRPHVAITADGEEVFLEQYMIYLKQDGVWRRVGYFGAERGPISFISLDNETRRSVAEAVNDVLEKNPENKGGWRTWSSI